MWHVVCTVYADGLVLWGATTDVLAPHDTRPSAYTVMRKPESLIYVGLALEGSIKLSSYRYRKCHPEDKSVIRSSHLHNEISFTGQTAPYCRKWTWWCIYASMNWLTNSLVMVWSIGASFTDIDYVIFGHRSLTFKHLHIYFFQNSKFVFWYYALSV